MALTTSNGGRNGTTWLIAWRTVVAGLMVSAIFAAWQARGELATLTEAVNGLKTGFEKIDDRVRDIERKIDWGGS